jgi:beta-lactamase class A
MLTSETLAAAARLAGLETACAIVRPLRPEGSVVEFGTDRSFYPASMIKTPLAVVAYDAVASGSLRLDDRFDVTEANMTFNDKPSPLIPGYRASVRELIELMITISDNVATNMFFDILGRERATTTVRERYGLRNTTFHRKLSGSEPLIVDPDWVRESGLNTHPPRDAVAIYTAIAADEVPYAAELRATLGRQQFNDKLVAGLRSGDRFYHKTGETDTVSHDGGILETVEGNAYVIVVYSTITSPDDNARFAPFMNAIRPLL